MKFEFTGETKVSFGVTLKRIRALVDIGLSIRTGDIGGWIEKEANVSGNAWVSGDAQVYGNAWVSGDAQVYGNARCLFQLGPLGSRNATLTIHTDAKIGLRFTTGCFTGSKTEFLAAVSATHGGTAFEKAYQGAAELASFLVDPA